MISNPRNHTRVEDAAPSFQPQHEHDGEQHPRRTIPQAKACALRRSGGGKDHGGSFVDLTTREWAVVARWSSCLVLGERAGFIETFS